jgi:hypothetical protein
MRKVTKFINDGTPCPTVLIIEHYLRCKREGEEVPARIDEFISTCLKNIASAVNQGLKPNYDDIFNIKFKRGRNPKQESIKLDEIVKIGSTIEDIKDNTQKEKHKKASSLTKIKLPKGEDEPLHIKKASEELGKGIQTAKKAYTRYKKL